MHSQQGKLTKYPIASLRELWHIAAPLMIMSFSAYAMIFADRMILSRYSIEAMNASVVAGAIYMVFMYSALSLSLIAEVFVGQHNGAGRLNRLGEPVWQMLWFALMSIVIFWPVGYFCGDLFLTKESTAMGIPYFKWIMLFGPAVPMIGALSAFYVGRGKTLAITIIAALANGLNVVLDYLFVFGVDGFIPSMGISGAAIATGIAQATQAIILLILFLKPKNRKLYGTNDFRFKKKEFLSCIKIGGPNAVSFAMAIAAWAFFSALIAETGLIYMTALTICQTYAYLLNVITDGMSKAITAITANLIGAKNLAMIPKLVNTAMRLHGIFIALLTIPLIIYSSPFINVYIANNPSTQGLIGLYEMVKNSLLWLWVIYIFEGVYWILMGQLTAAGDTKFLMYLNTASGWLFLLLPAYLLITVLGYSPTLSWKIIAFFLFMLSSLIYLRYRSGKWRKYQIFDESPISST